MNPPAALPRITGRPIRVGVIGASPDTGGWATTAHLPAIRALPDLQLSAVSTSRPESAQAAAKAFGVRAYHRAQDLIEDPEVDLVVVAVKVPEHHALLAAAVQARKHVLSEWPLDTNAVLAESLAAAADHAGVRTFIGLQARFAPAVRHAASLVRDGYIGRVLGTTLTGSGIAWGPTAARARRYIFEQSNGAHVLAVPVLHALDALHEVLGEFASVAAASAVRRPTIHLDDGTTVTATAPDHIALSGLLQSGAVASVYYRGATTRAENLRWEINGTDGDLLLTSNIGNLQVADLTLQGARADEPRVAPLPLPIASSTESAAVPESLGANVLRMYAQLVRDFRAGTQLVPDFSHAVRRHRLLEAIERAAASGIAAKIGEAFSR